MPFVCTHHPRLFPRLLLPLVLFAFSACSSDRGPSIISASSYDSSCTQDADCVVVFVGDVCGYCRACTRDAINKAELARYSADVKRIDEDCPEPENPAQCAPCPHDPEAYCAPSGKCATRSPAADAGPEGDATTAADSSQETGEDSNLEAETGSGEADF